MLAQASENTFLNVLLIACIGIVAEISMNDRFTVIVEENAKDGFARSLIVGAIKREGRSREACISLLGELPQSRDRLGHRSRSNETALSHPHSEN